MSLKPCEFKRDTSLSIAKNAMEPVCIHPTILKDLGCAHMKVYAGIDLHSSINYVGIINDQDQRVYQISGIHSGCNVCCVCTYCQRTPSLPKKSGLWGISYAEGFSFSNTGQPTWASEHDKHESWYRDVSPCYQKAWSRNWWDIVYATPPGIGC